MVLVLVLVSVSASVVAAVRGPYPYARPLTCANSRRTVRTGGFTECQGVEHGLLTRFWYDEKEEDHEHN